ncbi:hypothetical protein YPPY03_3306, partial [Yersinia pestis PY-03]
MSLAPG